MFEDFALSLEDWSQSLSRLKQAEGPDAFSDFHLYVCSVFLHKWTDKLKEMDFQVSREVFGALSDFRLNLIFELEPHHTLRFPLLITSSQGIIMFLQSLPTQGWSDKDAEMLLSEAFMWVVSHRDWSRPTRQILHFFPLPSLIAPFLDFSIFCFPFWAGIRLSLAILLIWTNELSLLPFYLVCARL